MNHIDFPAKSTLEQLATDRKLTKQVLLLGNDDRILLAVARGLGREGITVHVGWCDPGSPALKSRYISRFHAIPPFEVGSADWLDELNRLVEAHEFDLVIPCNDFAVIPLQFHRARLDAMANWYLISDEAFRVAFDKSETSRVARTLGISTPQEYSFTCNQIREASKQTELANIGGRQLNFPVYLKPHSSITQDDIKNKRSAERIESAAKLAAVLGDHCPVDGWLVQESFDGVGIGVEVLASEGEILMQLQHRRLRETIDGGSTYRETIAEIPELTDATGKLVRRLNYTGVAMFEFRYCPKTGDWVFLEINARFWGSLPLAVASGMNFPLALYELLVHGRRRFDSSYLVGIRCRNLVPDLRAFRKQQHSKLQLSRLLLGRDHLDFFASDDWRPQLSILGEFAGAMLNRYLPWR